MTGAPPVATTGRPGLPPCVNTSARIFDRPMPKLCAVDISWSALLENRIGLKTIANSDRFSDAFDKICAADDCSMKHFGSAIRPDRAEDRRFHAENFPVIAVRSWAAGLALFSCRAH